MGFGVFFKYRTIREQLTAKITLIKRPRRIARIVAKRQNPAGRGGADALGWTCAAHSRGQGPCLRDPESSEGSEERRGSRGPRHSLVVSVGFY